MSLFSDVNFDEGSDNPFGLEAGTHEVSISKVDMERSQNGNLGLWLTFTSNDKKSIRKWITMPEKDQPEDVRKRNTSFLRLTLRQLEIPESKWEKLEDTDFLGIDCVIIVAPQKDNPDYYQIKKISRSSGSGSPGVTYGKEWTPADLPKHQPQNRQGNTGDPGF